MVTGKGVSPDVPFGMAGWRTGVVVTGKRTVTRQADKAAGKGGRVGRDRAG